MLTSAQASSHREEAMELIRNGKIEECQRFFEKKINILHRIKNKIYMLKK
jgi:hypothetical protein